MIRLEAVSVELDRIKRDLSQKDQVIAEHLKTGSALQAQIETANVCCIDVFSWHLIGLASLYLHLDRFPFQDWQSNWRIRKARFVIIILSRYCDASGV